MSWNFCNDDIKFVNIAERSAVKISKEEFESKIMEYMGFEEKEGEWYKKACLEAFVKNMFLDTPVKKDLTVNVGKDVLFIDSAMDHMLGIQTLKNGLTFLGGLIRGFDDLTEVYFCIYYNGKTFRLYIPTYGNTFNKEAKCAFGRELDDKTKNFKKYENLFNIWTRNHDAYNLLDGITDLDDVDKNEILSISDNLITNPHAYTKIFGDKILIFDKLNFSAIRKDLSIAIAVY